MDRIGYFLLLLIFVQILTIPIVQGRHHGPSSSSWLGRQYHCRGGGQEEDDSRIMQDLGGPMLTVAILGKDSELYKPKSSSSWMEDVTIPTCIFVQGAAPIGSIVSNKLFKLEGEDENNEDTDVTLVETLAFLCDVVVVLLPKDMSNSELDPMWQSIVDGANRRKESGLPKGHLFLVSTNKMEFSQDDQQKLLFASVETVTTKDLPTALQKYLTRTDIQDGTISTLFNSNDEYMSLPFTELTKKVYQSISPTMSQPILLFRPLSASLESTTTALDTESAPTDMEEFVTPPNEFDSMQDENDATSSSVLEQDNMIPILSKAQSKLAKLESKVEDAMLALEETVESNEQGGGMPLIFLDFGNLANELLNEAYAGLKDNEDMRSQIILTKIVGELQFLYKQHLQLMRDYYGRRYEKLLDHLSQELATGKLTQKQCSDRAAAAVEETIQNFSAASQHAIPKLCLNGEFESDFDFSSETKGLLDDIMEATNMRTPTTVDDDDEENAMEEAMVPATRWQKFKASIPPWAKSAMSKGIMLGVNYAQGWLAWQGLKRAAAERDRKMPKFPLF